MDILVNKTSRVVNVDSLMLVPGVSQKVGDVSPLLSMYPRFKTMVEKGEIVVKKEKKSADAADVDAQKASDNVPQVNQKAEEASDDAEAAQEETKPRRRAGRKKE